MMSIALNDMPEKLYHSDGESPLLLRDEKHQRSRWAVDTYIHPKEGTRYLTLTVALLSSFALFVGMLCTGLAMLNHYYGLRISISLANWPATTLEIDRGEVDALINDKDKKIPLNLLQLC